jgi:hypothetical protein
MDLILIQIKSFLCIISHTIYLPPWKKSLSRKAYSYAQLI